MKLEKDFRTRKAAHACPSSCDLVSLPLPSSSCPPSPLLPPFQVSSLRLARSLVDLLFARPNAPEVVGEENQKVSEAGRSQGELVPVTLPVFINSKRMGESRLEGTTVICLSSTLMREHTLILLPEWPWASVLVSRAKGPVGNSVSWSQCRGRSALGLA